MSILDNEPLSPPQARQLAREILKSGVVNLKKRHLLEEMENDNLSEQDVVNVIRGGVVEPGEFENGSWRYRFRTPRIYVVVAFRSETSLVAVTAWRVTR